MRKIDIEYRRQKCVLVKARRISMFVVMMALIPVFVILCMFKREDRLHALEALASLIRSIWFMFRKK